MVALNPRLSGTPDRVIEIVRPTVADPEQDGVIYGVKRGGKIVKSWQVYGHETGGNVIRLRLDLGLNQDFAEAVGTFPAGTDIFFETEDGLEHRYTIRAFHPAEDVFDYTPAVRPDGQVAEFQYAEDLAFVPGVNQRAAGAAYVVAELDRPFDWPEPNIRIIKVDVGYPDTPARDLYSEPSRKAWARLEINRITPEGRETEWTVSDPNIEIGDLILYSGLRFAVREIEGTDRSDVRQVRAIIEADGTA